MPIDPNAVLARLNAAHERFLDGYVRWGGYQFHGWTAEADQRNYHGPVVWSEADCVLRFALELEREFPEQVHCEVKINKSSRLDFPSDAEKAQQADIAVSDLGAFEAGDGAYDAFRSHRHALFVEVKWFQKGWRGGQWEFDGLDHVRRVEADLVKLDRHLRLGRCQVAAMLVVDDEGLLRSTEQTWRGLLASSVLRQAQPKSTGALRVRSRSTRQRDGLGGRRRPRVAAWPGGSR